MPYADLPLANVYYESTGHGPALVFAHGAGGNALSWWQQTAFFSSGYRCITFDHPGFRYSSWNVPADEPAAFYGNVLCQLLDHLEIENVGLVAQSMGGWTCLRFALDHPGRTATLVMAATDGGLYLPSREHYTTQLGVLDETRQAWAERLPGSFHPACGSRMRTEQPDLHDMYVEIGSQNGDADGVRFPSTNWTACDARCCSWLEQRTLSVHQNESRHLHPKHLVPRLSRSLNRAIPSISRTQRTSTASSTSS